MKAASVQVSSKHTMQNSACATAAASHRHGLMAFLHARLAGVVADRCACNAACTTVLKQAGDKVQENDVIAQIETDKVSCAVV